jgi:hypothetical protein
MFEFSCTYKDIVWILKEIITKAQPLEISTNQLEAVIILVGEKYDNVHHPDSWTGDRNPWNAAEFVRNRIDALSAIPNDTASLTLKRLLKNEKLNTYRDFLLHSLTNNSRLRREVEYQQPRWDEVVESLGGGKPANAADLHALILDNLETLKTEIKLSNTDPYKAFWRCNSSGAVDQPEIEDICRDRLIELLRPRVLPLGIRVEPEGHMAADKRADIVVLSPHHKLPVELKRHMHPELWTACENQLERLYTRDPEAEGYGIYVAFWFGIQHAGKPPMPPTGIIRPESASDLERALRSLIPIDKRHRLEAVVIDVAGPD